VSRSTFPDSQNVLQSLSGKAVLVKPADLTQNQRLLLDLGKLNDLAEVSVNGKKLGVLWYPPYQIDITDALKIGQNQLEITVTNNWATD